MEQFIYGNEQEFFNNCLKAKDPGIKNVLEKMYNMILKNKINTPLKKFNTILCGPSKVGKTTLLCMMSAIPLKVIEKFGEMYIKKLDDDL